MVAVLGLGLVHVLIPHLDRVSIGIVRVCQVLFHLLHCMLVETVDVCTRSPFPTGQL